MQTNVSDTLFHEHSGNVFPAKDATLTCIKCSSLFIDKTDLVPHPISKKAACCDCLGTKIESIIK